MQSGSLDSPSYTLHLMDLESGEQKAHKEGINSAVFNTDGKTLIAAVNGHDNNLAILDLSLESIA